MEKMWEMRQGGVKEVYDKLRVERDIAPTTVSTILDKLYKKGLLDRELVREKGLRYIYKVKVNRDQLLKELLREKIVDLISLIEDPTAASLLGDRGLEEIRERLRRLVE